jgi:hypothetical protein
MVLRLRTEKGVDFVKGEAKAWRGVAVFEPTHRGLAVATLPKPTVRLHVKERLSRHRAFSGKFMLAATGM